MKTQNIVIVSFLIVIAMVSIIILFGVRLVWWQIISIVATGSFLLIVFAFFILTGFKATERLTTDEAKNMAIKFWRKMTNQDLTYYDSKLYQKRFSNGVRHFAFLFRRKTGEYMKPLLIYVCSNPKDIYAWDDNPSPAKLLDPFFDYDPYEKPWVTYKEERAPLVQVTTTEHKPVKVRKPRRLFGLRREEEEEETE